MSIIGDIHEEAEEALRRLRYRREYTKMREILNISPPERPEFPRNDSTGSAKTEMGKEQA